MDATLITKKIVNALIRDVTPSATVFGGLERAIFEKWRQRVGGLWVGGDLFVFTDRLRFEANALNRAVQGGDLNFEIRLDSIASVERRWGLVTSIVDVIHGDCRSSFRCFGSGALAKVIEAAVGALRA